MAQSGRTNRNARVKQTVLMGLLFALAMVLSYIESMFTLPGLPPGVKLGLSNIVTMYCVFFLGGRQAYTLAVLKGFFTLLTRGLVAACMSTAGGLVSVSVMLLLIALPKWNPSYTLISVCGSLGHNLGQLLMASVIMQSGFVIYYLPVMAVSGVGMGVVTGILLRVLLPYMDKLQLSQR